ncbi:hypothetical protein [Novosphingobium sp.]|uniref:hypothetical protein n=1 Tax=Novosphingobium sp. TaxID=1874826 RepID=UPI00260DA400|nr:hypothetical protein [Novosphingobium sp.]
MRKALSVLLVAMLLAGCGARRELQPLAGRALPPAPYGREDKPRADVLLTPPVQAKPQRNIELRSRSEDREDDPFDLPPED